MALFRGKHAYVKIGATLATVDTATDLWSQLTGTNIEGIMTNITFKEPEQDSEVTSLLGSDATGQQNQVKTYKDLSESELSGKLILDDAGTALSLLGYKWDTVTAPAGQTRYQLGEAKSDNVAVAFKLDNGTKVVTVLMNNATVELAGPNVDVSADGFAEVEVRIRCLAKDTYVEHN